MSRSRATLAAVGVVVAAALVGQLLAGDDPRGRLESLLDTPISLPFTAWIIVGVAYYAISATVVYRLVRRDPDTRSTLILYLGMLLANELWNYLLFAPAALWPAVVGMIGFAIITIGVALALWRCGDRTAFWVFVPYAVWVIGYDVPWIVTTWIASM